MIGLIVAIITFNFIAFKTNKRLTKNQIVQIWTFTVSFQSIVDTYIDGKLHGYWYFYKDIDYFSILPVTVLVPAVNIMFLNWYPFKTKWVKKFFYFACWEVFMIIYEYLALFPSPWGYFHYGWWKLWYSAICDPILLLIVVKFYKWMYADSFSAAD